MGDEERDRQTWREQQHLLLRGQLQKESETSKRHVCLLFRPDSHTHVYAMHVFFSICFPFSPLFFRRWAMYIRPCRETRPRPRIRKFSNSWSGWMANWCPWHTSVGMVRWNGWIITWAMMRWGRPWTPSSCQNRRQQNCKQIVSPKADAQNYDDAAFAEVVRDDEFITMHAITKNPKFSWWYSLAGFSSGAARSGVWHPFLDGDLEERDWRILSSTAWILHLPEWWLQSSRSWIMCCQAFPWSNYMLPIPCLFLSGVCSSFTFRNLKACAIAVYMPTTWHSDDDVEQVYGLLDVLLDDVLSIQF